jgi:hypothetical protein
MVYDQVLLNLNSFIPCNCKYVTDCCFIAIIIIIITITSTTTTTTTTLRFHAANVLRLSYQRMRIVIGLVLTCLIPTF